MKHKRGVSFFIMIISVCLFLSPFPSSADDGLMVKKARKPVSLTGYTRSIETLTLSTEVGGKLVNVAYDVGDIISEKPFFVVDTTFINLEIEKLKTSVKQLDVSINRQDSQTAYLEKEFIRIDTLHKGDRATEVRRDQAAESLTQAKLEKQALLVQKKGLQTQLKELYERKKRYVIKGPKNWVVINRLKREGEVVNAYAPLAVVSDFQNLVVPLFVSAEEYKRLRSLESPFPAELEGMPVKAEIHQVNPEFNEKTRKLSIELLIKGYTGEKRGGLLFSMPVEIEWKGYLIPKAAVVNRYENPRITLKKTGETINVLILGELNGDVIIAEDERIREGDELAVK